MISLGDRWKKNKAEKHSAKPYNDSINFYDIDWDNSSFFGEEKIGEEKIEDEQEDLWLDLSDSIYKFDLSERTFNALIKNWISKWSWWNI